MNKPAFLKNTPPIFWWCKTGLCKPVARFGTGFIHHRYSFTKPWCKYFRRNECQIPHKIFAVFTIMCQAFRELLLKLNSSALLVFPSVVLYCNQPIWLDVINFCCNNLNSHKNNSSSKYFSIKQSPVVDLICHCR